MINNNYFFSFKLVLRLHFPIIWSLLFIVAFLFGIGLNILAYDSFLWSELMILCAIYTIFYIVWGVVYLAVFKRGLKFYFPLIPWFGIMPKKMLTLKEYKRFEISYIILFLLSLLWILIIVPETVKISFLFFFFLLFTYRIILFIRIIRLNNPRYYIKYNSKSISIYMTDFKDEYQTQ